MCPVATEPRLSLPQATGAVYGVLVAAGQVAAACAAAGVAVMQQWDVLLLLNTLAANQSFRHSGEAMAPICLPRFNPGAPLRWLPRAAPGKPLSSCTVGQVLTSTGPSCVLRSGQPACVHSLHGWRQ